MTENKRRLDRILDESYLADVQGHSTPEIRSMRAECQEEEALLSYERRLLHGRLAILGKELDRRASDEKASLVEMLPSILADERQPSRGSFPASDPHLDFQHPSRKVSKLVSDDTLANLPRLSDDEIRSIVGDLEAAERDVSGVRRTLLDVLDALNKELARRYQSGEADPSDVLSGR
jgi:anti-sigma-K factor RsiG